jgi:hypothetical protein
MSSQKCRNGLQWKGCISVCTYEASSVTGKMKGFVVKVWEVISEIKFDHCLMHRKVIIAKTLPCVLKNGFDEVVKIC